MSKIALAMIVKDDSEYEHLDRALKSASPHVDAIYLTGTKEPQDKIKELAEKYKAHWSWFAWQKDFSAARNFNFSQVPKDYEWIFWMDCDDMLHGGENLRQAVEIAETNNISLVYARYLYQVELDEQGGIKNILVEHLRERLIRNNDSTHWVGRIHETCLEKTPLGQTDYQGFMVVHLSTYEDTVQSMDRNLEILEEEVLNKWQDPRPLYYLAKAYFDTYDRDLIYKPLGDGLSSLTIELLKEYLRKSGWAEERAQAWEYLAVLHREMGDMNLSVAALLEALNDAPVFPSVYIQLALTYVIMKDWKKAMHWVRVASSLELPKTTLVVNPTDYKRMILESLFYIYFNTGQLEKCLKVATDLLELVPNDVNRHHLAEITDLKTKNDIAHYIVKLANHLFQSNQQEQLKALINAIPSEIANEPVMMDLRNQFITPRTWDETEVAIYCGPGFEQWSWKSVSKGVGGSEEAVIYMSAELAKLGWKVTVFADPREDEGEHEGVNWLPYYHINWADQFNVFVSWRQIQVFDKQLKARKTYLWNHDIQNALTYTKERVGKIDKVMFLSKWHRQNVPDLAEDKVMYTSNGIQL